MDDFKIVINGKAHSCTKRDKVYVELDNSVERSDVGCTEIKHLVESFNITREPISCTIHIKKKSPNYKRMHKFSRSYVGNVIKMRTDEELIAEHNIQVIASVLLEVINVFCKVEGCENRYIRDLGDALFHKYGEQLKDIIDNGNSI